MNAVTDLVGPCPTSTNASRVLPDIVAAGQIPTNSVSEFRSVPVAVAKKDRGFSPIHRFINHLLGRNQPLSERPTLPLTYRRPTMSSHVHSEPQAGGGQVQR